MKVKAVNLAGDKDDLFDFPFHLTNVYPALFTKHSAEKLVATGDQLLIIHVENNAFSLIEYY